MADSKGTGLPQPVANTSITSSLVMGAIGSVSRAFVYGLNSIHVTGLERFLGLLEERRDVDKRQRGLITVSNHISILDDPLMWGVLPYRYQFDPANHRWGLGAHDICFKNKPVGAFFYHGQILPTHRLHYSPHGGLFQPTMNEAIRLLSGPRSDSSRPVDAKGNVSSHHHDMVDMADPFTADGWPGPPRFTTDGIDSWVSPTAVNPAINRHGWVHIFPEACVHQHPRLLLRYFKWGCARLILEAEPMPDVLPIFIDGTQRNMPEDRRFPRFVPRPAQSLRVAFGEPVDTEALFGDLRRKWRELVREEVAKSKKQRTEGAMAPRSDKDETQRTAGTLASPHQEQGGCPIMTDRLKYGDEAEALRIEVARRVRAEVLKLRRKTLVADGDSRVADPNLLKEDEDDRFGLAETWAREPKDPHRFTSNVDNSKVNRKST